MPDISTVELTRTKVRLRDDLVFVPQQYHDGTYYHLEVSTSSEYYRIGYTEYVFVSLLDGRSTFSEALAIASQVLKDQSLNQAQALAVYSWLLDNQLVAFVDEDTAASGAVSTVRQAKSKRSILSTLNPLWLKIPLGRPQTLLQSLQPSLGWIFSPAAAVPAVILMLLAGATLSAHWTQFTAASANVIARDNWLWLLLVWVVLKVLHEIGHGLVCLRYGGTVRETGVILALFAPLAYVDASSSWSFRSRWQRIHTAIAGVFVELVIASIAVLIWSQTRSVAVRHVLQNVIVMASVSTLLFNLNPLMKFDGYYILSDLLRIPNLAHQANSAIFALLQKFFLGTSGHVPVATGRRREMLLAYGIAAIIWRMLMTFSILLAASVLFHGAGLVLACIGAVCWFGKPIWNLIRETRFTWQQYPERFFRASSLAAVVVGLIIITFGGLPAPIMTTAPGVVEFRDGALIRAETPGFVETVHVKQGQSVQEGDLLVSLRNDDVTSRLIDLQQKVAQEEAILQTATTTHESAALHIAQGNLNSYRQQLKECRLQVEQLQLRASRSGRVIGRELQSLEGTYAKAGMELLTVGVDEEKEVQLSIGQRDLPLATTLVGRDLRLRIGTSAPVHGKLVRVNPKASRSIPHESLAAINGGPLSVVENSEQSSGERLQLTEHRFTAILQLPPELAAQFYCGQRGTVTLGLPRGSLGHYLWRSARDWFETQLKQITRAS